MIARLWLHHRSKFRGRDNSSPVKMIDRREGIRSDRDIRPVDISKRGQHTRGDALARVVLLDLIPASQLGLRRQLHLLHELIISQFG